MKKKVIIAAANGLMGKALSEFLKEEYEIVGLVRKEIKSPVNGVRYRIWDGKTLDGWCAEFEDAFAVINIAGKSVDCRYTPKNKKLIYSSQLESTKVIGEAIDLCKNKPKVWLNAASATIYRHELHTPNTEENGVIGEGFSVDVCKQWEATFFEHTYADVRQVALRTTIVLGKDGGAFPALVRLAKFGLGGKQGKGNQQFSWIHIEDFNRAVQFILDNESLSGPINIAAPFPERNRKLMKDIRKALKMPIGIPLNKTLLEFGARIIKTETELILKSRYVVPEKLEKAGFEFRFPRLENAVYNIITSSNN